MSEEKFLTYKDKPLVRHGDELYYGDMAQPFVMRFQILSTKNENGNELPEKVSVELLKSDIELPYKDRVVKKTEKNTFFNALDVGFVWLDRALKD